VLVIKYVAEFANNAWCWLSNMWRSLPTTLGVGYQICGGVCQQRLVLVIKSVPEFANNAWCWLSNMWRSLSTTLGVGYQICGGVFQQRLDQHHALLPNSATYLITNTKRC
jgi:hypothetical protein